MWFKRLTGAFSRFGKSSAETAKAFDDLFNCFKGDDKNMFDFEKFESKYIDCKDSFEAKNFITTVLEEGARQNIYVWFHGYNISDYPSGYYYVHSNNAGYDIEFRKYVAISDVSNAYNWSDFMEKKFTKADLKNGDVIKRRNGFVEIVCVDTGTFIGLNGWNYIDDIREDLTHKCMDGWDIVMVRRPTNPKHCQFSAYNCNYGTLVYDRERDDPEIEEMTMDDVCKALGKRVKIVDRK